MKHRSIEWLPLTLRPTVDAPADMPPGEVMVRVPVHPEARETPLDTRWAMDFGCYSYVKASEPVSYEAPFSMEELREWFERLFAEVGYGCRHIIGHSGSHRIGEYVYWTVLTFRNATMPDLDIQITLHSNDTLATAMIYRAEQHPVPARDPASFLPFDIERIEVEYTFMNGPKRNVWRTIRDPAAIRMFVELLNSFPREIRSGVFGRMGDRWADLRLVAAGGYETSVHVDTAHDMIRIGGFPALFGSIWAQLLEVAPPGKGAGGMPWD